MSLGLAAGRLDQRLTLQTPVAQAIRLASLTRSGTTATATTSSAHGFVTGEYVTVAGAVQTAYNAKVKVTVTSTTAFSFAVAGSPTTPATGQITATYASDAQGGRVVTWTTVATVPAELLPMMSGSEGLQAEAVTAQRDLRFRIRTRADVTSKMRALWTPRWPPSATERTLEVHAILPDGDGVVGTILSCGELT